MNNKKTQWVPVLTNPKQLCLTTQNWLEVGQKIACCYLDELLVKPGSSLLSNLPSLASYVNWQGTLVLNASQLKGNKSQNITIKSPYDGSTIQHELSDVWSLIVKLQPDVVLMPQRMVQALSPLLAEQKHDMKLFWHASEYARVDMADFYGVYGSYDEVKDVNEVRYAIQSENQSFNGLIDLNSVDYLESNEPVQKAIDGLLYTATEELDIKDKVHALDFEPIDKACHCPTCLAPFSKAYLHHLYEHTPLLCQRFLAEHNSYFRQ